MSDLGEMLRSARQKKNVTLDDVAAATRIKTTFLAALEDGDYSQLPGPAYITGFLRNYASYVGLHPDDVVQEYYAARPMPQPTVKAATKVLASGYHRENRARLLWIMGAIVLFLAGGYAIKQYNDASAHSYTAPVNVTASMASTISPTPKPHRVVQPFHVQLQAMAPVWVRVTVDGHRAFQGILRAGNKGTRWTGYHAIYVMTFNGAQLRAVYNGRPVGLLAAKSGVLVDVASAGGWRQVS